MIEKSFKCEFAYGNTNMVLKQLSNIKGHFIINCSRLLRLGLINYIRLNSIQLRTLLISQRKTHYHELSVSELLKTKTSDTIFIFGSGYSLNTMSKKWWDLFSNHDTLGNNYFIRQQWIPIRYHFIREMENNANEFNKNELITHVIEFTRELSSNPLFDNAVLFMQKDYYGYLSNLLIGNQLLDNKYNIFRYRTWRGKHLPTESFREGIPRSAGAIGACINIAYLMGWKNIVLVGVDLYDNRYFWLGYNEARDTRAVDLPHRTVQRGVIEEMGKWRKKLLGRNVNLSVFNKKSLLTKVLPVFDKRMLL